MKMKMMMSKKIAFVLAVFFFSFNLINVYEVSAFDTTITIGGGSLGTNGLDDLAGLFPYAAPIILGMLHQADMDIKLSQQSQAAGMTKTQYLYDQIINWKDGAPEAVGQVCERILTGTSVDAEGIIYVGQTALDLIRQFGNWVVTNINDNFVDTSTPSSEFMSVKIGDIETFYGNTISTYNGSHLIVFTASTTVAWFRCSHGNNRQVFCISPSNFTATMKDTFLNSTSSFLDRGKVGNYYMKVWNNAYASTTNPDVYNIGSLDSSAFVRGLSASWNVIDNSLPDNYFQGSVNDWSDFIPGLTLPAGYTGAIDFGILNQILAELEESKNYEMTVEDYLQAINEAVNDQAIDVPMENVDDGSIAYVPDVVIVPDPAYDPVADPDIPVPEEVTPVIDDEAPPNFEDLMNQPLTLDLKRLFPFCIPFDLYNLFQKFNAPATAPHFRINFTIPIVNQEVDYTIDFAAFNDVAAVLRTMELIAMVVLLAIATRRIFLRG